MYEFKQIRDLCLPYVEVGGGLVTQDAGALARHWHRTKVHPTAWQGHLPSVRHRGLRKRMPRLFDCGTKKIECTRQTHIAIMFSPRGLRDNQV